MRPFSFAPLLVFLCTPLLVHPNLFDSPEYECQKNIRECVESEEVVACIEEEGCVAGNDGYTQAILRVCEEALKTTCASLLDRCLGWNSPKNCTHEKVHLAVQHQQHHHDHSPPPESANRTCWRQMAFCELLPGLVACLDPLGCSLVPPQRLPSSTVYHLQCLDLLPLCSNELDDCLSHQTDLPLWCTHDAIPPPADNLYAVEYSFEVQNV